MMRGSAGSGKSYVGFQFLDRYPVLEEIIAPAGSRYNPKRKKASKTIGYVLPGDLAVLGTYKFTREQTYSGGLEAWTWKGQAVDMRAFIAEQSALHEHVYFEGLLPSMSIKPYLELAERVTADGVRGLPFVFGFLNTPMHLCYERIMTRNGGKEIDADTVVRAAWKRLNGSVKRAYDESPFWSPYVPYERSYEWTEQAFRAAGWSP